MRRCEGLSGGFVGEWRISNDMMRQFVFQGEDTIAEDLLQPMKP